ncbi:DUF6531 domain-containing protein [Candidatus Accumulibacter phosphatis]|uniref:DUF6531 domain-containing protein n=1 Tax=Candidatus Accumulibacter phosphatis TaxID=327160 RepID=UPI00110A4E1E|nr:DUF6531 domain-containing protein [Candidatus Accumulibacter phosphatis]
MMYDRKGPPRQLGATLRLVFFAAAATSPLTAGAATCTVGAGVSTIGNEFFATAAYPDGSYEYQVTILLCSGGVPSYCSGTPFVGTPDAVIRAYRALNFSRVFRNQCGSMGLIPHDRFLGAINDGVATVDFSLAAHPLSATYTDEFVKGIAPGEDFPLPCGCSGGLAKLPGSALCTPAPPVKAPDLCLSNPILPGQGCKIQRETDYTFGGASPLLTFQRYYHSQSPYHSQSSAQRSMGNCWRHNHDVLLNPAAGVNLVLLLRGDGQILHFHPQPGSATDWVSDADIVGLLQKTPTGWSYRDSDDAVETFDAAGRRLSRVERGGRSLTYHYQPGSDRLADIQDPFGRRLSFTYNAQNLLTEVTTPAAEKITYTYADGHLASVTYPDSHSRHYRYTSITVGGHVEPALLSGLTDENATPYATWTYDPSALAASSEHAGGVDRHTFVYQKDATGKMTGSTVTNPLAAVTQYQFERTSSAPAVSRRSASPSFPGSPAASPTTPATATS